jgi:hypothetical protein
LFSREDVSNYLNQNFEPAWEMVRQVPIIRIDFGNGNVTTRTLHGNVASYVCGADGKVVDILPGIYTPAAYTTALEQPRAFAGELTRLNPNVRQNRLQANHREQAQRLRNAAAAAALQQAAAQGRAEADIGKRVVERRVEIRMGQGAPNVIRPNAAAAAQPRTAAELAAWQPLIDDARVNETERRLQIHDRLTTGAPVRPEQIKRWLYRDVLHADLDDPFMGLGGDFFADIER